MCDPTCGGDISNCVCAFAGRIVPAACSCILPGYMFDTLRLVVSGKEVDVIDGKNLRRLALAYKVPIITTVAGAKATTSALAGMKKGPLHQVPLQDYFPEAAERSTVEFKVVG